MIPFRISILTCNLWNTEKWENRKEAIGAFLHRFDPDICCFQELRIETMEYLDGILSSHSRILESFNGWNNESNIYYRTRFFKELNHGEVNLNMPKKDRRLFWVELKREDCEKTLTIATVHLTHQNNADEQATGLSFRHGEAEKIAAWYAKEIDRIYPLI